jgi:S-DNA-T family DNA segregation ATPase FtsK/SpoIIIE
MTTSKEIRKKLAEKKSQFDQAMAKAHQAGAALLGWQPVLSNLLSEHEAAMNQRAQAAIKGIVAKNAQLPLGLRAVLENESVANWQPTEADALPTTLPFGHYRHSQFPAAAFPASIPFIGQYRGIVLACNNQTASKCRETLLSLLLRTVLYLPQRVRYFLIDPANAGNAFISVAGSLPHRGEFTGDVYMDLRKVQEAFQRIQTNFLNPQADAFEKLDPQTQASEKLQFVFVADFPLRFDRRSVEMLQSIAINGPRNGTYVFIEWNVEHAPPAGMQFDELKFVDDKVTIIDTTSCSEQGGYGFKFGLDTLPTAEIVKKVLDRAKEMEREDVGVISFTDQRILPPREQWWTQSSVETIETAIGMRGAHDTINLWFGEKSQKTVSHGIVAGATGSGKSVFLHVLISGLAARYSPEELKFCIIDMKDGVELSPYERLPHTAVISSNSSPELARSILDELTQEMNRRNGLIKNFQLSNIAEYRRRTDAENMPRILLIVDEYQRLFVNDREGKASALLAQLAEQGRSAGIHILLASQKFEAAGMEHADAIFNNFHLRMALQLQPDQIDRQQMFGTAAHRSLLRQCDVSGKIVVSIPDAPQCLTGRVALLSKEDRSNLIQSLHDKGLTTDSHRDPPIVLDGLAEPRFFQCRYIWHLAEQPEGDIPSEFLNELVRDKRRGLGESEWLEEDHPISCVLGKDFSVRGYASMVFRRRSGDNALVISSESACERFGILVAIAASALLQKRSRIHLELLDFAQPNTRWHGALASAVTSLAGKYKATFNFVTERKEAEAGIDRIYAELERRKTLEDAELSSEKSILVFLTEPDRVQSLQRQGVGLAATDSPAGSKLKKIYHEGPLLGIHVVIGAGGAANLWQVIDRRVVELFRYRVCLQIDEKSSYDLLGSGKAANLNRNEPRPIRALLYDQVRHTEVIFKPYPCASDTTKGIVADVQQFVETGVLPS